MNFLALLVALLFLNAKDVYATDIVTPDSSVSVHIRNEINTDKPVVQEIKQKVETGGEEIRVRVSAVRRERIRSYFSHAVTRVEALIDRLNNLISRIETRIEKINEEDPELDTSSAQKDLDEAKKLMADAKDQLEKAKEDLETAISSDDPKDSFKNVVETFRLIKSDFMEVHKLLVHSIGEIKGLRVGDTKNEE